MFSSKVKTTKKNEGRACSAATWLNPR